MGWLTRLQEDIEVARQRDPAARNAVEILVAYPGIHALIIYRLAHALSARGGVVLPRLIAHFGRWITGIEIHPRATIGRRLFIDHGMGIVIGETAVIGDDCHLYQEVTLGGTSTRREKRHPTLEDGVVVGAGAKIIGAVTIGMHARIGAGSVVISNVPAYATVVGVPGHIVAFTNATNDTVERLPDPEWDRLQDLERRIADLERSAGLASPGGFDGGAAPRTTSGEGAP